MERRIVVVVVVVVVVVQNEESRSVFYACCSWYLSHVPLKLLLLLATLIFGSQLHSHQALV